MPIKKLGMCLFCVCTLLLAGCGKNVQLGYIDNMRLQEASQLKAIMDEGNSKITEVEQEVMKKIHENPAITEEEAMKITGEGRQKAESYRNMYQVQLQQLLNVALSDIAKEKKLDAIIEKSPNPMQPVGVMGLVDVTDDVIAKLK